VLRKHLRRSPKAPGLLLLESLLGVGTCESGHWIESVASDGKIIKFEDGSLWEVDDIHIMTTSILPISDVVVCETKKH
jgi:hypothetical protein